MLTNSALDNEGVEVGEEKGQVVVYMFLTYQSDQ